MDSTITPYYRDEWVTLYHGDCREVLPALGEDVDITITDPPYSEKTHKTVRSREMRPTDRGAGGAASSRVVDLGFAHLDPQLRHDVAGLFAARTRRWVLVFSDAESAHLWRDDLTGAGLDYVRTGAWIRENGAPQFSGDRPAAGFESVTICHPKGRKRWNGGGKRAVWSAPIVIDRGHTGARLHTAQKPDKLMHTLVDQFTEPGETILDAFAGSGSTLAAATLLGRKSTGIELDERNCEIIARRLAQAPLPLADPPAPVSRNSAQCHKTRACSECGTVIAQPATGRPRTTCSDACRTRASRRRRQGTGPAAPIS